MPSTEKEILEGYVVDVACIRKFPQAETAERARVHTRDCGLMGHCVESGYGLVDDEGRVALLDSHATPGVAEAVRSSGRDRGIRVRVERERDGESMKTRRIEEI